VLTACLKALVPTRSNRFILACWRHGLATALICQRLARPMHLHESNAYTAGLIHDIGQLALLNVFPSYEEALIAGEEMGVDILAVEKDLFGLDHGEAGRWLLAEWGCPLVLQEVAGKHENPPLAEPRDTGLIRLVHAGSELANLMGMSAAAPARHGDIAQIAATLPEASGELTAEGFGYLSESIITKVNGVELSLGFGMGQ
jgi:HD-like signal output (HDOD) protein